MSSADIDWFRSHMAGNNRLILDGLSCADTDKLSSCLAVNDRLGLESSFVTNTDWPTNVGISPTQSSSPGSRDDALILFLNMTSQVL